MPLSDPIAVYNAANNLEAIHLRNVLVEEGIEAYVTEDVSQLETWVGGLVPELHEPQVWVEKTEVVRVKPVIEAYVQRVAALHGNADPVAQTVDAVCEECGKSSTFPAEQHGTVQTCPHCGEFLDVGPDDTPDEDFGSEGDDAGEEPSP